MVIALIFTLCSCKKINNGVYSSSSSDPDYVSEISTVTEEYDVSNTESDDTASNITASTPVGNTSSKPVVDNSSKETSSIEQTTEEKPK